jgi:peptide subunit release factor 1 (eRF1)
MAMTETYELPPERLGRWLERWAERHGPVARTKYGERAATFHGAGGEVVCEPPFPPLAPSVHRGFEPGPLLEHVRRERTVGVLLVRLGGHAAGVFEGRRLVDSKVGSRLVHARHRKGGSSQKRFARRREGQAREALAAAADNAARILLPRAGELDAVVLGGDRRALAAVLEDPRLEPLSALAVERVLEVADTKLAVLRAAPDAFLATTVRLGGSRPAA